MYRFLLLKSFIALAAQRTTAQQNTASSTLAQLQNCKTELLFTDYLDGAGETDTVAYEQYWQSTGAPKCAYDYGQIGCLAMNSSLAACVSSPNPQGCFCLAVAQHSCPDLCRHNSDPSTYTQWILEHYCFGPHLTTAETCKNPAVQPNTQPNAFQPPVNMTVEAYKSSWKDYDSLQLASHTSLFPWQWEVAYNPAGIPNASGTYKCPSKSAKLVSFAVINVITVFASLIFGNRQVIEILTCKWCGSKEGALKRWLLGGTFSAAVSIGANAINAKLIRLTPGFGNTSISNLILHWCARPRLAWLGGLFASIGTEKHLYTSLGASCTFAEGILQTIACVYMGRTAHWGAVLDYLKHGHLGGIPGAHDATIMYAGSLLWLATIGFLFAWALACFFVDYLPSSTERDNFGVQGIIFSCLIILPLIGQWLFWAGFIGLAGDRYVLSHQKC